MYFHNVITKLHHLNFRKFNIYVKKEKMNNLIDEEQHSLK